MQLKLNKLPHFHQGSYLESALVNVHLTNTVVVCVNSYSLAVCLVHYFCLIVCKIYCCSSRFRLCIGIESSFLDTVISFTCTSTTYVRELFVQAFSHSFRSINLAWFRHIFICLLRSELIPLLTFVFCLRVYYRAYFNKVNNFSVWKANRIISEKCSIVLAARELE